MADFTPTDQTVYDPEEVIFAADGSIESMTDPDSGEVIKADPKPAAKADPSGPYDGVDDDGNRDDDDESHDRGDDKLDPVLADMLNAYGFDDDDIEWNGEQTRVRDLSPEDRKEYFNELRDRDRQDAAGTSPEEQELLDFLRQGGDLRQALGVAPAANSTVGSLSADEVNLADIRQQYPNLSDEEVQEELDDRKASSRYEAKTGHIRERLTVQEQEQETMAEEQEFRAEQQQFVQASNSLTEVLGFRVAPEVKQFLLSQTATKAENGNSPFLNSLTPDKVLRLQFLDTYAGEIDKHYQAEIKAAEKRGYQKALSGAPTTPSGRGGSAGNTRTGQPKDDKRYADYTLGDD